MTVAMMAQMLIPDCSDSSDSCGRAREEKFDIKTG